jgi:hypothetical protein
VRPTRTTALFSSPSGPPLLGHRHSNSRLTRHTPRFGRAVDEGPRLGRGHVTVAACPAGSADSGSVVEQKFHHLVSRKYHQATVIARTQAIFKPGPRERNRDVELAREPDRKE